MARLFIILILLAAVIAIVVILHAIWTVIVQRGPEIASGPPGGSDMATNGISKAAYIALIVVLFGTASGWLGGL